MAISCLKVEMFMADTIHLFASFVDRRCRSITGGRLQNLSKTLAGTLCEAVVISSEALEGLLRKREYANAFFNRIRELNLEPKLVVFPRNQPQSINSRYVEVVRGFRRSEPFEAFVSGEIHQRNLQILRPDCAG